MPGLFGRISMATQKNALQSRSERAITGQIHDFFKAMAEYSGLLRAFIAFYLCPYLCPASDSSLIPFSHD
jgi:hypothetical protein